VQDAIDRREAYASLAGDVPERERAAGVRLLHGMKASRGYLRYATHFEACKRHPWVVCLTWPLDQASGKGPRTRRQGQSQGLGGARWRPKIVQEPVCHSACNIDPSSRGSASEILNANWHRVAFYTVPAGVTTPIGDNLVDIHVELSGAADACFERKYLSSSPEVSTSPQRYRMSWSSPVGPCHRFTALRVNSKPQFSIS
jgi:hypothetical protein